MKKKHKRLVILSAILGFIITFMLIINLIPPVKVSSNNAFILKEGEARPMLAAHRGGSLNNPENTMLAFSHAISDYHIDIVETDIWLTKDEKIVFSHDGYIDRMSDVALFDNSAEKHYIADYTLDELKNFNFGYGFKDKSGNYPYRDLVTIDQADRKEKIEEVGLQILEVGKLFERFYNEKPDLLFIVEIKNSGDAGYKAANALDDLLTNVYPNYKDRVVVGTFHDEISADLRANHPTLLRGASTGDAAGFIITQLLKVNIFNNADFVCLQIPTSYTIKGFKLKLDKKTIINRAHRRGMAVQFWTINDAEEMKHLADLGCDCIMTDDPELFNEVFG